MEHSHRLRIALAFVVPFTSTLCFAGNPPSDPLTYQGQLKRDGVPVNGVLEMVFTLWSDPVDGTPDARVGDTVTIDEVELVDGLFMVSLAFGADAFAVTPRWLQIAVVEPGKGGPIVTLLSPRQPITAAPFSLQTRGLFVSAFGRIGIGTTSPDNTLHIHKGSAGTVSADSSSPLVVESSTNAYVSVLAPSTSESGILFGNPDSNTAGGVVYNNSETDDGLQFRTNGDPRMVVNAAGNVGVGTTSPDNTLHVLKGPAGAVTAHSNSPLVVENSTSAYVSVLTPSISESGILFGNPDSNTAGGVVYNNSATDDGLQFRTNGNLTRMVVDGAGNIGVAATQPESRLDVRGTITSQQSSGNNDNVQLKKTGALGPTNVSFRLSHRSTGNQLWMYGYDGTAFANLQEWDYANRSVEFPPGGGTLHLDLAGGRVGIGTTAPTERLHVVGGTDAGPSGTGGFIIAGALNAQNVAIDDNEIAARNNGALTRLTLNGDGGDVVVTGQPADRVGIGTVNPQVKLDVRGTGDDDGGVSGFNEVVARFRDTSTNGHTAVSIDANSGQDAVIYFAQNGTARWGLRLDDQISNDLVDEAEHFQLRYHTRSLTAMDVLGLPDNDFFTFRFRGSVRPWIDAEWSLGTFGSTFEHSGGRWKDVWAANAFIQTSDRREKKNIRDLEIGLAEVLRLRPVTFQWNRKNDDGGTRFGLVAQEVNEVIPDAVVTNDDPNVLWGMSYAALVPIVIRAVQQQQEQLESIRKSRDDQIAALRAEKDAEMETLREELLEMRERLVRLDESVNRLARASQVDDAAGLAPVMRLGEKPVD